MIHKISNDKRALSALNSGMHIFTDPAGIIVAWNINKVIGFGGSCIAYDVTLPQLPSKHFVLKEYFPFAYANMVIRDGMRLVVDNSIEDEWDHGVHRFEQELEIQKKLPASTGKNGHLFNYAVNSFKANNTAYIVFDADQSVTLSEYIKLKHTDIENSQQNCEKVDNSALKVLLKIGINVCKALSIFHKENLLHLDVSDTNILVNIRSNEARLFDFASAKTYNTPQFDDNLCISYTADFSPIEQTIQVTEKKKTQLTPATDTYALCAVLYKCLFDKVYDPILDAIDDYSTWQDFFYELPEIPLCPNLSEGIKKDLLETLKKGLGGIDSRYTANELQKKLEELLDEITTEEDPVEHIVIIALGITLGIILFWVIVFFIVQFITLKPPKISATIDTIYSKNETIAFDLLIYDYNGIDVSDVLTSECLDSIKTVGFYADKQLKLTELGATEMRYKIELKNIIAEEVGEKQIVIDKIYESVNSTIDISRWNNRLELSFYYGENISCTISAPSVNKVNSDSYHEIEYILEFSSPVNFSVDMKKIKTIGFTAEKVNSKKVDEHTYSLTFQNIHGDVGDNKYFIIPENSAFSKDNKLYLKQTNSPTFSIVEDTISNKIISVSYRVFSGNWDNDGYVILSPEINTMNYTSTISVEDVKLIGFTADIKIADGDIILYNLQLNEVSTLCQIYIAPNCFFAENGSTNSGFFCELKYSERPDTTCPVINILRITKSTITENTSVLYKLYAADESEYVIFNDTIYNFIETVGFKADIGIKAANDKDTCYIILTNIVPSEDVSEYYIIVKEGLVVDKAGNPSKQVRSHMFAIE